MTVRMVRRLMVVSAVVVSTVALGAVPADAATATLSIPYANCQNSQGQNFDYLMRVEVTLSRTYIDGGHIVVRIWGDDPSSDDLLVGPVQQNFSEVTSGQHVLVDLCVNKSTLNEDIGTDEIYAGVRVFSHPSGAQTEVVESNRIVDDF
jgi:hypothetical protein